ncbi:ABC transporter substrate-binding protein [Streptomyces sp. NPDC050842]|uniref:ABC transporter substrate-binding protein n=1 Tax=Streptomyces sp. NPDC050842 TaxID=3365636 RepID=UPI0037978E2D
MPARPRRAAAALAATASIALFASACTGSTENKASDDPNAKTTITFWHGWSAPSEVAAIKSNVARFEKAHPNIKVKLVGDIADDKLSQALRAGGSNGPDVAASFTTSNVGKFCHTGAFADLKPFLEKDKVDLDKTFSKVLQDYTQFEGKRCTLPLLSDAYGLYYNKDAFKAAGLDPEAPPKTWSEFAKVAKTLTKAKGDSYEQLGFMPNYLGYETVPSHYMSQWNHTYFDESGKSNLARDPGFAKMLSYQKSLVDGLGGFAKLDKYRTTFGDEWGAKHPFHTGQVAMQLDGEWRLNFLKDAKADFEVGVAPLPVADDEVAEYGKGYLSGTIMGIAPQSTKQNAAWELVKYMTMDTEAVVSFANDIGNVPSTLEALKSPNLKADKNFKVFLDIAQHPESSTSDGAVNGSTYQDTFQDFAQKYEKGQVPDLKKGLADTAAQIDRDIAQAK